jgi:hypothetical protein
MNPLKIYIGFDPREQAAYDIARKSIQRRARKPDGVFLFPVELEYLRLEEILNRPVETRDGKLWCPISQAPMATEFAISRFAVPFMAKTGLALFVDCDIVCLEDIANLFALADLKYAVMCVQHQYEVKEDTKMDGQAQTKYSRKNWSSVMLFNCDHPANKRLTKKELHEWPGRDLHAFKWLKDDEIGALPAKWNQLVGVHSEIKKEGIVHFTLGGPWFKDWKGGPMDDIWLSERNDSRS